MSTTHASEIRPSIAVIPGPNGAPEQTAASSKKTWRARALAGARMVMVALAVALLTSTVAAAQSGAIPPPGMIGWWPADGNADDLAGSNDGALLGGMTFDTGYVTGGTGQAFSLDGVDDRVEIPHSASFDSGSLSAAAWIKINSFSCSSGNAMRILEKLGPDTGWTFDILCDGDAYARRLRLVSVNQYASFGELSTETFLPLNEWTHVAFTYDGVGEVYIYINGQTVHHQSWAPGVQGAMTTNTEPFKIGYSPCCRFNGLIDEVQLFNRAITPEQMVGLYAAGSAGMLRDGCPYNATSSVDAISRLADTVMSFNLQRGISNSLDAKLSSALEALGDINQNNNGGAANKLGAFLGEVEAQRGSKLTQAQADTLHVCGTIAKWWVEGE